MTATAEITQYPLKQADRCDSCTAQALTVVTLNELPLLFCGHHFNRHADALTEQGARLVTDERGSLT